MDTRRNGNKRIMMIAMLTLLLISMWVSLASARSGGPDYFGYTFKDSNETGGPSFNWIEINTTGTSILSNTDDNFKDVPVGFSYNFYGIYYSSLSVTNNGMIIASGATDICTVLGFHCPFINQPISNSTPHNFIAPFWDDIVTGGSGGSAGLTAYSETTNDKENGNNVYNNIDRENVAITASATSGAIYYQTLGTAPNRMLVVEWENNQHYRNSEKGVTFETILYEGSNDIKFQYKDVDFGNVMNTAVNETSPYNNGRSATVGIEGPGTPDNILSGKGSQYSFNEPVINSNLAIMFSRTANLRLQMNVPPSKYNGTTMNYTLNYYNFGRIKASNVTLLDTLPQTVIFVSASNSGVYDEKIRQVTWNIGSVDPSSGGTRVVTVGIRDEVQENTVIQNTASISTTTPEANTSDNTVSAQTIAVARPQIFTARTTGMPQTLSDGPGGSNHNWMEDLDLPPGGYDGQGVPVPGHPGEFCLLSAAPTITLEFLEMANHFPYGTNIQMELFNPNNPGQGYHHNFGKPYFSPGQNSHGNIKYTINAMCEYPAGSGTIISASPPLPFDEYVDPAGYVYDADTFERIAGAKVTLQRLNDSTESWENAYTGLDPLINPQNTTASGQYQWFVINGSYRVHVEATDYYPADSRWVTVPPPVTDLHVGLKHLPAFNISGFKINDANGNGLWDAGEAGVQGWKIVLKNVTTGTEIANTTTDEVGFYKFKRIVNGSYNVTEEMKEEWTNTSATFKPVTLAGQDIMNLNFTNKQQIINRISGYKINDTNGNGKWNAGEKGISNWTIRLIGIIGKGKHSKVIRKETFTDATGFYKFDNLQAGRYFVIEKHEKGFVPTSSPVKRIKLAQGKNSLNNNFTNRPVHSRDRINGQMDIDEYEVINRDIEKYKEEGSDNT